MACQFCYLQGPPFHKTSIKGTSKGLALRPVTTPLQAKAWIHALAKLPNLGDSSSRGYATGLPHRSARRLPVQTMPNHTLSAQEQGKVVDPMSMQCTNLPIFHISYVNFIIWGIRRANATKKHPTIVSQLPTKDAEDQGILAWEPHSYKNVLAWAAARTGFCRFLCFSEFMTPDNAPLGLLVHLCACDRIALHDLHPLKHNTTWSLHQDLKDWSALQRHSSHIGATGPELCPVMAISDFLVVLGKALADLFVNSNGAPMCRGHLVRKVKLTLHLVLLLLILKESLYVYFSIYSTYSCRFQRLGKWTAPDIADCS